MVGKTDRKALKALYTPRLEKATTLKLEKFYHGFILKDEEFENE